MRVRTEGADATMPPVLAGGIGDVVAGWLCGGVEELVVVGGEGGAVLGEAGELSGVEGRDSPPDVEGGRLVGERSRRRSSRRPDSNASQANAILTINQSHFPKTENIAATTSDSHSDPWRSHAVRDRCRPTARAGSP